MRHFEVEDKFDYCLYLIVDQIRNILTLTMHVACSILKLRHFQEAKFYAMFWVELQSIENPNLLINQWEIHPNNASKVQILNLMVYDSQIIQMNVNIYDKFGPFHTFVSITKIKIPFKLPHLFTLGHILVYWYKVTTKSVFFSFQSLTFLGYVISQFPFFPLSLVE